MTYEENKLFELAALQLFGLSAVSAAKVLNYEISASAFGSLKAWSLAIAALQQASEQKALEIVIGVMPVHDRALMARQFLEPDFLRQVSTNLKVLK